MTRYRYKYEIISNDVNFTAINTKELAKFLGISMSSIPLLVNDTDKHFLSRYIKITRIESELFKKKFNYTIVTKPIHFIANNSTDISKLLGISMSSVQILVNNTEKKHLLSQFITITRTDRKK